MKWSFVQNRAVKKDEDQTEKRKTAIVPKTLPDVGTRRYQMQFILSGFDHHCPIYYFRRSKY